MNIQELDEGEIYLWDPDGLDVDPNQPRQEKNWDIANNAANMTQLRKRGLGIKGTGVIKPVIIRLPSGAMDAKGQIKPGVRPIIVDGEGRTLSARRANELEPGAVPLIPVVFEDVSPDDAFELAYYANAHTIAMSPIDEAFALLRIKQRYEIGYEKLAQRTNHTKEYVRSRLKAIGEEDTLPILEKRRDALSLVKRINMVTPGEFRNSLIQMALSDVPYIDIEDTIAANREGLTLERYRAEKAVRKAEAANKREADKATSYKPHSGGGAKVPAITKHHNPAPPVPPQSPPITPPPPPETPVVVEEKAQELSGMGIEIRPFVGDALDALLYSARTAKEGLADARLSIERREDLTRKAYELRDVVAELIGVLDRDAVAV